jgi:hypothetical protein
MDIKALTLHPHWCPPVEKFSIPVVAPSCHEGRIFYFCTGHSVHTSVVCFLALGYCGEQLTQHRTLFTLHENSWGIQEQRPYCAFLRKDTPNQSQEN